MKPQSAQSSRTASTPGVARAFNFLKGLAGDPEWRKRGELPGVRTLARLSGISHFTLWKALRCAAESKLLIVAPGRRPRLAESPHPSSHVPGETGLRKWERLRLEIERDLLQGNYKPGETVPLLKELQGIYRVSYSTLRKALRELERSKQWPPVPNRGSTKRDPHHVVYLTWGDEDGNPHFDEPFDHEYLKALRSACESLNLESAMVVYGYRGSELCLMMPSGTSITFAKLCERAIGFVVRTACPRDVCADLLPQLERHHKPIAVLDEIESPSLPDWARRKRLIKSFRPTITEASGEIMARHLLSMGHRRVALISPFRNAVWSRNRLAGLAATLRRADREAVAVPYTLAMPYLLRHAVRENRAFLLLRRSLRRTPDWGAPLPSLHGVIAQLETDLHLAVRRERILEAFAPLLMKALKRKDLTAWVAVDDDTAMLVMDFLSQRGLQIPRDISLVGFDDTAAGARRDLTSYNFDFERFNYYVLRYLLDPSRVDQMEKRGAREPEGRVVARGSLRRR